MKTILDLCGGTGSWSKFYKEAGYNVVVATLPDWDVNRLEDRKSLCDMKPHGILAAPPCTMFSLVRQDKTSKRPRDLREGMECVKSCLEIIWECSYQRELKFWALENPRGYLKLFLGAPALVFDPCDYGDPYNKKTCLWGNFNHPKQTPVPVLEMPLNAQNEKRNFVDDVSFFQHLKKIPDGYLKKTGIEKKYVLRSMTPLGFARRFFEANP